MTQTTQERQRKIRDRVESMSVQRPDDPDEGLWYGIRDDPNYYRFTHPDTADEGPLYDVWLHTETRRNKLGALEVTIEVVQFDCRAYCRTFEQTIFSGTFDGYQPTEQAFLLNAHKYEQQAQDAFDDFVAEVEYWVHHDDYHDR